MLSGTETVKTGLKATVVSSFILHIAVSGVLNSVLSSVRSL